MFVCSCKRHAFGMSSADKVTAYVVLSGRVLCFGEIRSHCHRCSARQHPSRPGLTVPSVGQVITVMRADFSARQQFGRGAGPENRAPSEEKLATRQWS